MEDGEEEIHGPIPTDAIARLSSESFLEKRGRNGGLGGIPSFWPLLKGCAGVRVHYDKTIVLSSPHLGSVRWHIRAVGHLETCERWCLLRLHMRYYT